MDFRYSAPTKSPKIHPNRPLLYINFAVFFIFPKSKSPNPQHIVGSIYNFVVN
nr:MAG TPA: hypothetical protein [Caudoviricetes sp.]